MIMRSSPARCFRDPRWPRIAVKTGTMLLLLAMTSGCATMWPFGSEDRTSFHTPAMRADAIRQMAAQADGTNSSEQQQIVEQLARQIQIEGDPLVREAIIESASDFRTPLAERIVVAGLRDASIPVRIRCCQLLGRRGEQQFIAPLSGVLKNDANIDVRLAAIAALGQVPSEGAVTALGPALDHRDPAVKFAAMQALKSASGEDFGNSVPAWQQYVAGEQPDPPQEISVAERLRRLSPL